FSASELLEAINTQLAKREVVTEQAEKKLDDLRNSLVLTLPHELRTPLSGILGYAQFMAIDPHSLKPERIAEIASRITRSGLRLQRLIENYLIYAQLEMTRTSVEWT